MADLSWRVITGAGVPLDSGSRFLETLASCVPGVAPFTTNVIADPAFQRSAGTLPLWLEPDLDYADCTLRIDPAELDDGLPTIAVLLHEFAHLFLAALLQPHRQVPWLAEAICDYCLRRSPVIRCYWSFLSAIHGCLVGWTWTCATRGTSRTVPATSVGWRAN